MTRKLWLAPWIVLVPTVAAAQLGPPPPPLPTGKPAIFNEIGFDQNLGQKIPLALEFRDETGAVVRLSDYFGERPVVLSLVYYKCPMLCTISLNGLARALNVLAFVPGQEFEVLTVSFDPKETPDLAAAKKKVYLAQQEKPEAAHGWHFLTGSQESVSALTKAVGFRYAWDEETKQWAHPAGLLVVSPQGVITHYLYGVEYSPRDLRLALVDSAEGRIGSPVDQVLLFCFQYDPSRGRYSASILNIVRLAGVATVLAMAGFILSMTMSRRGEKSPPPGGAKS
jgi:protein SCO1/2